MSSFLDGVKRQRKCGRTQSGKRKKTKTFEWKSKRCKIDTDPFFKFLEFTDVCIDSFVQQIWIRITPQCRCPIVSGIFLLFVNFKNLHIDRMKMHERVIYLGVLIEWPASAYRRPAPLLQFVCRCPVWRCLSAICIRVCMGIFFFRRWFVFVFFIVIFLVVQVLFRVHGTYEAPPAAPAWTVVVLVPSSMWKRKATDRKWIKAKTKA